MTDTTPYIIAFGGGYGYISPLASMLLNASRREYEHLRDGLKTVQGCPGSADRFEACIGKYAQIKCGPDNLLMKVIAVRHYPNIYEFLDNEGVESVAPYAKSRESLINRYHKVRSDYEIQALGGICAVELILDPSAQL